MAPQAKHRTRLLGTVVALAITNASANATNVAKKHASATPGHRPDRAPLQALSPTAANHRRRLGTQHDQRLLAMTPFGQRNNGAHHGGYDGTPANRHRRDHASGTVGAGHLALNRGHHDVSFAHAA